MRDGADLAEDCLASILANRPDELVLVDGGSTDGTLEIARRLGVRVVGHDGTGPASARMAGARVARNPVVVLVDVDVVLPEGELSRWYQEYLLGTLGDLAGLQADLAPESVEDRYWGARWPSTSGSAGPAAGSRCARR